MRTTARWRRSALALLVVLALAPARQTEAWGDEGHRIVALIADHYLDAAVRKAVQQILSADDTHLVSDTGMASEATWADKYRDSDRNTTKVHYDQTHNWHFVDIELSAPDIDAACNHHPSVPAGTPASAAEPVDCVADKIAQFTAELASSSTPARERLVALQFLLHFVGDLHQPLHAADDHDKGGNAKRVKARGNPAGNLHAYWDTNFVRQLGPDETAVAHSLASAITSTQQARWCQGSVRDWAQESFQIAATDAYGKLPAPQPAGSYNLDSSYVDNAATIVGQQLSKAGVRLACILNQALGAGITPGGTTPSRRP